jgi:hypothetical protein
MAELREYRYLTNGHETTGMLSDDDAKLLNAVPLAGPTTVASADQGAPDTKARPVANKARGAEVK